MTEQTTATIIPLSAGEAEGNGSRAAHAEPDTRGLAVSKFHDALTPGFQAEFSPEEAEMAGAFPEDALSEADAFDSAPDARA